jgi:hypothetical protein
LRNPRARPARIARWHEAWLLPLLSPSVSAALPQGRDGMHLRRPSCRGRVVGVEG